MNTVFCCCVVFCVIAVPLLLQNSFFAIDFAQISTNLIMANSRALQIIVVESIISAQCSVPPDESNFTKTINGQWPGDTTTYTCSSGYYLDEQGSTAMNTTCQSNGTWTALTGTCRSNNTLVCYTSIYFGLKEV